MKILVLCDRRGNLRSVAIPNPEFADRLQLRAGAGKVVHELEVDPNLVNRDVLGGARGEEARKTAYATLRAMIPRPPRPRARARRR